MPKPAPVGTIRRTTQGYYERKMRDGKWKLLHKIVMEKYLGRRLEPNERIYYKNNKDVDKRHPKVEDLELRTVEAQARKPSTYILPEEKACNGPLCQGKIKPIRFFYIQKNGHAKSYCKACTNAYWDKKKHDRKRRR